MAQREKVPSVYWVAGNAAQMQNYWIAVKTNEGAEELADYINILRAAWIEAKGDDASRAVIAKSGKRAAEVYKKHFG